MVNDRNKRGIHTVRGRLGSPRTPMIAFNSVIVTCLARSTACATCCWCCRDREVWPGQSWARGQRAKVGPPTLELVTPSFFIYILLMGAAAWAHLPALRTTACRGSWSSPSQPFLLRRLGTDFYSWAKPLMGSGSPPPQGFCDAHTGSEPHFSRGTPEQPHSP